MRFPSFRGLAVIVMTTAVLFFSAACGSRTGDYGEDAFGGGGAGGDGGCNAVGEACSDDVDCCDADCESGFCGGTCTPDAGMCSSSSECCSGDCSGGICGATTCSDIGEACIDESNCCGDLGCVDGFCFPEECAPDGVGCMTAGECCSGVCENGTCGVDACAPDGASCLDATECCSLTCINGTCGSPGCTHSECDAGAPLDPFCTTCTTDVCNVDPFCCDTFWDDACVSLAQNVCLINCGNCQPDGGMCAFGDECCSGNCNGGICTPPCQPNGTPCNVGGQCCSGDCTNGFCGPGGDCPHGECTEGPPLSPQCTPCAAVVCQADPFCCQQSWDGLCVSEAEMLCGIDCGNCSPDGSFCNLPSDCCSNQCNNNTCGLSCLPDGNFCNFAGECCSNQCNNNTCGSSCSPDGAFCNVASECCSNQCTNNTCGGPLDCSHDECTVGSPLSSMCTPCTQQVCAADAFCCQTAWDDICVGEAEQICGLNCSNCTPDGGMCINDPDCCSGSCDNGVCGPPCQPDGAFCIDDTECCSDSCNNNICGVDPVCPSDGSPCGDCVAQNCCSQLQGCFASPGCIGDVLCFQQCVSDGTPLPLCFFQCITDPEAFNVLGCLAGNCSGTCF